MSLPPDKYEFVVTHPRRQTKTFSKTISLVEATHNVSLKDPAKVTLSVKSGGLPVGARWMFEGVEDTPNPNFGPDWEMGGAGTYLFTPSGADTFYVPPGKYKVTCSRGPGYEVWQQQVSLKGSGFKTLEAQLAPVVFEPGWLSVDLHTHGIPSPDSRLDQRSRVLSAVCEGVDILAVSDHGHRSDYGEVLGELNSGGPSMGLRGDHH